MVELDRYLALAIALADAAGEAIRPYFRQPLAPGPGRIIAPGESLDLAFHVPCPAPGDYTLEFDLVSEGVCWFAANGCQAVRIAIHVD